MRKGLSRRTFLQLTGLTAGGALLASACSQVTVQQEDSQEGPLAYANPQLLVESDWLEANLGKEGLRIIDIRSADDYAAGHVPQRHQHSVF